MIILNAGGGLGNQMFGYAYAKALAEEYGEELYYNVFWTRLLNISLNIRFFLLKENGVYAHNSLKYLACWHDLKSLGSYSSFYHSIRMAMFYGWNVFIKRVQQHRGAEEFQRDCEKGFLGSFGPADALSYYTHEICNKKRKYVFGPPSSEKYFRAISDEIKKSMKVTEPQSMENFQWMKEIESCNSVCVHVRRGDYFTNPSICSGMGICTETYYLNSINYIKSHCKHPIFYIFSNNSTDIQWIKDNYHFDEEFRYVDLNNPDYEELRLMYSCKHFIISNSSFSWWASFLSENPDKIVLAPEEWIRGYKGPLDIYRDDMIKIPVNLEGSKA